jgi:hypothetical protein
MKNYKFIQSPGKGLVVTYHPEYGEQIWSLVKVRKYKNCLFLGIPLRGKEAYMPVTNLNNRMERISKEGMQKLTSIKLL